MIRVNLSGAPTKKNGKAIAAGPPAPSRALPLLLIMIVVGSGAGGFWWYTSLSNELKGVELKIAQATAERDRLAKIIKQNQIYEGRKKMLEARIKIIQGLKRGQVSPVRSLDILDDAIDRTKYVWLSSLEQNNAEISMSGTGTSVNAIADFYTNLKATGYFRNINLQNAQDSAGNYTFRLTCEFALPAP